MTPAQIRVIRETWNAVAPVADAAAQLFYQRLFEIDPSTKPLFARTDMAQQNNRLLSAVSFVVENAEQISTLTPFLEEMGRRHARYGVKDRHYDSVGSALIWTLEHKLGPIFTEEAHAAWAITYAIVSGAMRRATDEASRLTMCRPGLPIEHPRHQPRAGEEQPRQLDFPMPAVTTGTKACPTFTLTAVSPAGKAATSTTRKKMEIER
jgi:hemoglobin-like flavoprotein